MKIRDFIEKYKALLTLLVIIGIALYSSGGTFPLFQWWTGNGVDIISYHTKINYTKNIYDIVITTKCDRSYSDIFELGVAIYNIPNNTILDINETTFEKKVVYDPWSCYWCGKLGYKGKPLYHWFYKMDNDYSPNSPIRWIALVPNPLSDYTDIEHRTGSYSEEMICEYNYHIVFLEEKTCEDFGYFSNPPTCISGTPETISVDSLTCYTGECITTRKTCEDFGYFTNPPICKTGTPETISIDSLTCYTGKCITKTNIYYIIGGVIAFLIIILSIIYYKIK